MNADLPMRCRYGEAKHNKLLRVVDVLTLAAPARASFIVQS